MDLANSLKRGIGAVSVSVALVLFSANVSAIEMVPVRCNAASNVCGGTLTPGLLATTSPAGTGWDLEFENTQFLVPNSDFKLFVDFTAPSPPGAGFPPLLNDIFLTTKGSAPIVASQMKMVTDVQTDTRTAYNASISFTGLAGAEIFDFHLRCDNTASPSCNDNILDAWRLVGYGFDADESGGSFGLNGAPPPPVSSPETLALVSLALMGVAVPAARRRRSSRVIASA